MEFFYKAMPEKAKRIRESVIFTAEDAEDTEKRRLEIPINKGGQRGL